MADTHNEVIDIFRQSGALLDGHFILRSGLHSPQFFQCAQVGQYMHFITRLAELLLQKIGDLPFDSVLAPAMGGLVIGQEVARQANKRYIFAEKVDGRLELRRNFKIAPGERVLVVEDVITRGGRVDECLTIVRDRGATPAGVAVLVDRSGGAANFGDVPLFPLLEMTVPVYEPDSIPPELAKLPAVKPGS